MLVSAIISTYNSERFIAGCIEDLLDQTLYKQGVLEIIIVDSASLEGEGQIVSNFQKSYPNIRYIKLEERVTLYEAWNVGIKEAKGKFVTNANTDDRHHPESLEILSNVLINNEKIDLVYADVFVTKKENTKFSECSRDYMYSYKPYFAPEVLLNYQFGCQPVWRRDVHDKMGYFNPALKAAGDYEFNLRFALSGLKALHVNEPLGIFLENDTSISQKDNTSYDEQQMLRDQVISVDNVLMLFKHEGFDLSTPVKKALALHSLLLEALDFKLPWHPNDTFFNASVVSCCFNGARYYLGDHPILFNNYAVLLQKLGHYNQCEELMLRISGANLTPEINRNMDKVKNQLLEESYLELSYELR